MDVGFNGPCVVDDPCARPFLWRNGAKEKRFEHDADELCDDERCQFDMGFGGLFLGFWEV